MKYYLAMAILYLVKASLWFRYRVHYKGLENLNSETLNKPGGILFLPNHPTIVIDPSLVVIGVYSKFPIRPLIVEYMYYSPGVNWLMRFMDAIPIPNHFSNTNSLKRKKSERALDAVIDGVKSGENFLIYPAGKVKRSNYEMIGGSSGVHSIIQRAPETNVVLVRVKGLYGSTFSSALTAGRVPDMFPTVWRGIKTIFKNLLFFTPRRDVTIEYIPAPKDFPWDASKLEFNKYLEHWYNTPDGLDPVLAKDKLPGESLTLISHSMWRKELPTVEDLHKPQKEIDMARIPEVVRDKVYKMIAKLSERDVSEINPNLSLSADLGLDSLDAADILAFLQDQFGVENVPPSELTTVERLLAIGAKEVTFESDNEEFVANTEKWIAPSAKIVPARIAAGKIIPEVFLNNANFWGDRLACADPRSGMMTYQTLKLRVLLLADYLRTLDGKYIGIMLPASVAATVCILACQMAGKVPLMVNWTVGPRHLDSVVSLSGVKHILSAWSFVDRMENIDLDLVEDKLLLLEDLKSKFTLTAKLKALWRSKQSTSTILKTFGLDKASEDGEAVMLFTSGSEALPKGVPLSHKNILSNQRSTLEILNVPSDDILLGVLPPFHSFGFTVCSLIGILSGLKTAFSPDPTNGRQLARACGMWRASIVVAVPTFLKGLLRTAQPSDLESVRYLVYGAEKAPPELIQAAAKFGLQDRLLEGYGVTECSPVVTMHHPGQGSVGVGKAIPGVEICIVHPDTLEPKPQGEQGLVLTRGPNLFKGYLNPGLASPFVTVAGKSWYSTGDLGFLDEHGSLTLVGRLKRFIKIGGEMVSLAALEDALLTIALKKGRPTCEDSPTLAIVAEERDGDKPRVCLFSRFSTDIDEINSSLREAGFSNLVKVSEVRQIATIPIMGSGKINYRELKDQLTPK